MTIEITIADAQFADGEKLGGAVSIIERLVAGEAANWAALVASQDTAAIDEALKSDAKKRDDLIAAGKASLAAKAAAAKAAADAKAAEDAKPDGE